MAALARLVLRDGDRTELRRLVCDPGVHVAVARRAEIVLFAADGLSNTDIAARVGTSRPTVTEWRARYEQAGIAGLADGTRPGRPRRVDHRAIISATLRPPATGCTAAQWTCRSLARRLGVSAATVARAWRHFGVIPLPSGSFRFRTEPELEARVVQVVGLAAGPQGKVAVLRLDHPGGDLVHPEPADPARPTDLVTPPGLHGVRTGPPPAALRALVRWCAARHHDTELHVVADAVGRAKLRWTPAMRCWWAIHPGLHLYGIARTASWGRLAQAWLAAAEVTDG